MKTLVSVGCKTIANSVCGKSPSEIREMFNISYEPPALEPTLNESVIESAETSLGNDQTTTSQSNTMNT